MQLVAQKISNEEAIYFNDVSGDKNRFTQVLVNILSNSLKFSNSKSKILVKIKLLECQITNDDQIEMEQENAEQILNEKREEIQINTKKVSQNSFSECFDKLSIVSNKCYIKFMITIQDFGCGIPPDKLESIFVNFGNLEEHRQANPAGRGLGLSICKSIVEQMGGSIQVESLLG